jgi:hypothetical protein
MPGIAQGGRLVEKINPRSSGSGIYVPVLPNEECGRITVSKKTIPGCCAIFRILYFQVIFRC